MTGEPPTVRELIQIWQQRADDHQERANRLGPTISGRLEAVEAAAIRQCIADLLTIARWGM